MTHKTASAAWRSWNAASDERMNHPPGEEGLMLSLNEVVRMAREGRLHPRVRAWVTHRLRDAGDPKGIVPRADALLGAIRAQAIWVPDPDHTEQMLGAHLILDDIFAGGDCFPEGTLLLGHGHELLPVEQAKPGMKIWGLDRWSEVQAVAFKGVLPIDLITLNNGSGVKLTAGHKVAVLDCPKHPMLSDGEEPVALSEDKWWREDESGCSCRDGRIEKRCRVSEVRAGMVMTQPERIPFGKQSMDPDVAWIEGAFVADGWSDQPSRFCISGQDGSPKEEQKRKIEAVCDRLGVHTRWNRKYIAVNDGDWALRMMRMGHLAPNKHLLTIDLDEATAAATLEGVMVDSGKNTRGSGRTFTSTSKQLTIQTRLLHRMLGITCGYRYIEDHGGLGKNPVHRLGTRANVRLDGRGPWLLRVSSVDRDVDNVPCWDIQTDDHRVYLAEHDVSVNQCDDLTIAYVAALGAALENINGRVAIVGHAYDGGPYGHVLCALHDGEKWLFADPSTKKPIGTAVGNVTDEIMLDVMTGEVICQGICMVNGSNRAPAPKDPEGSGTFQRINGVPGYEIMEMAMLGRFEPGDTEEVEDDGDLAGHAALSDDMDREGVTAVPMGDLPQKSADLPTKPDCGCSGEHPWQDAWAEHVDLTRAYILTRAKLGQDAAVSGVLPRLMDNQDWLGRLFESVSKGSGPAVTALLKEHISKAGDVVEKLVAKEDAKAELTAWYVNAEDIAKALSKLGMGPLPDLREMMWNHLDATAQEAKAIVAGDEAKSMKWYEAAKAQALTMANEFAKLDPK